MKTSQTLRIPLAALAMLAASSAFAANRGSLHVSSTEDVAGKQVAAGDYSVRWEERASGVELTIVHGHKVVATAMADTVRLPNASNSDSVVIDFQGSGQPRLSEVFFAGQKVAFQLREPAPDTNIRSSNQSAAPLPSGLQ
jgi:hypothetical protein